MIGADPDLLKQGKVVNRLITWAPDGLWIEHDTKHVAEAVAALQLTDCNRRLAATPHLPDAQVWGPGDLLDVEGTTAYRAVAARMN